MPASMLSFIHVYHDSHFTDKETEAESVSCSRYKARSDKVSTQAQIFLTQNSRSYHWKNVWRIKIQAA